MQRRVLIFSKVCNPNGRTVVLQMSQVKTWFNAPRGVRRKVFKTPKIAGESRGVAGHGPSRPAVQPADAGVGGGHLLLARRAAAPRATLPAGLRAARSPPASAVRPRVTNLLPRPVQFCAKLRWHRGQRGSCVGCTRACKAESAIGGSSGGRTLGRAQATRALQARRDSFPRPPLQRAVPGSRLAMCGGPVPALMTQGTHTSPCQVFADGVGPPHARAYTCAHMHIRAHMHMHTCAHIYMRTHMHTRMCTHIHAQTCAHAHTCTHVQAGAAQALRMRGPPRHGPARRPFQALTRHLLAGVTETSASVVISIMCQSPRELDRSEEPEATAHLGCGQTSSATRAGLHTGDPERELSSAVASGALSSHPRAGTGD